VVEYILNIGSKEVFGDTTVIVEDKEEKCSNYEEVVRRAISTEFDITVNLYPSMRPAMLRENLIRNDVNANPGVWMGKGVPDILAADRNGEVLFVEVKSRNQSLRNSQFDWISKYDQKTAVAYVDKLRGDAEGTRVSVAGTNLFDLDRSLGADKRAIERILWMSYGNHGSSAYHRECGKNILRLLQSSDVATKGELMESIGLDPSSESDHKQFDKTIRPLKGLAGSKSGSNPNVAFVNRRHREGTTLYELSRAAFDASFRKLKNDIVNFLNRFHGLEVPTTQTLDKIVWLAYANHSNTYEHRQNARTVLKYLMENGEAGKQELMSKIGLEYGDENDDQRFRGMMKYLRGSWKDEEDALNPLHTSNHGFLVSQEMRGQRAYYQIDVREFKSSMNVVAGNIRSFLE